MSFTDNERAHRAFRPVANRLVGGDAARRRARIEKAIDDSGHINPPALVGIPLVVANARGDQTSRNTSNTSVYTTALTLTESLPDESSRWVVVVDGDLRATVSDGTSADVELLVNSTVLQLVTRPGSSTVPTPFFLAGRLAGADAVAGGQDITFTLRFKSDTGGTVTVGLQRLRYFCYREI